MAELLITGISGRLGRELAKVLLREKADFTGISRSAADANDPHIIQADLTSGTGVDEALKGITTVFHLASNPANKSQPPDSITTAKLITSCKNSRVKHFIYISIVGIDKISYPYYAEKLICEELVKLSGLNYTILRATQFHEYAEFLLSRYISGNIAFLTKSFKFQSIGTHAVAEKLFALYKSRPVNGILNQGGPEILTFGHMARKWLKALNRHALVIPLPAFTAGKMGAAFKNGYNTCMEADKNSITWQQYLDSKYLKA